MQLDSSYLIETIKQSYLRNSRIECLMNPAKSFPIEQGYINLAIVNVKEQHKKERQLLNTPHNDVVLSSYEEIYGTKTPINIKDIFQLCEGEEKQTLVFGRAGIGKSTLCRYIAYQWAKGSNWSQYELLALIPLRNLTTNRYCPLPPGQDYSLIDLVKNEVFSYELTDKEEALFRKQFDPKKTLWILDGYDEIIQNVPAHLGRLFQKLLNTSHHIITSRPYLNTLSYKVQMEITGFTDENIEQYIEQFFFQLKDEIDDANLKCQTLMKFLKSKPSIWGVAHIPVNLELICSLCSNQDWSDKERLSITVLYSMITVWLCRRYLKADNSKILQLPNKEIHQQCQNELKFLENLAFIAMKKNTIVIRPCLVKEALEKANITIQNYPHILNIGILKSFTKQGVGTQVEMEKDHYFVHLSFQEYFAAQYLINSFKESSTEEIVKFIENQKYNQRYTLVFAFAAGMLSQRDETEGLNIYWDTILGQPLDLVGLRHMELIIVCLEETFEESNFIRRNQLLQSVAKCIEQNLLTRNKLVQQSLSKSLRGAQSVVCDEAMINMLIALLQRTEADIKVDVLYFICLLGISNAPPHLINVIHHFLTDNDDEVRVHACEAIWRVGEKAETVDVLNSLVNLLQDQNERVRGSACYALCQMSDRIAIPAVIRTVIHLLGNEDFNISSNAHFILDSMVKRITAPRIISELVSALQDENEYTRHNTCDFLQRVPDELARTEVIDELVEFLEDKREDVRWNSCLLLGKIDRKVATSKMINKLVAIALQDKNPCLRQSACGVLEGIGGEVIVTQAITTLLDALKDKNYVLRTNACFALGQIGRTVVVAEMSTALKCAAEDENENVRANACEAIVKIRETVGLTTTMRTLVTASNDESEYVRASACKGIGGLHESTATPEKLITLQKALRDESPAVRQNACILLWSMGEAAATPEIIDALLNVIEEDVGKTRTNACTAIGMIGMKAATTKVIKKLLMLLEDTNANVRAAACFALQEMRGEAATAVAIKKLVKALKDEDAHVRERACCALWQFSVREKVAISEKIDQLLNALGDDSASVRYFACSALQTISEQMVTSEIIGKLVDRMKDQRALIRENVCFLLGRMEQRAATPEVIDKLMNALEDKNSSVRCKACWAVHQVSKSRVTTEMMVKFVSALADEDCNVTTQAYFILKEMKENITSEIVSELIIPLNGNNLTTSREIAELIGDSVNSANIISELGPNKIRDLCLSKFASICLKNVSEEQLIPLFSDDKLREWISAVMRLTLVRETAVTARETKIIVHGRKEPIELSLSESIHQQLVFAFKDQREKASLFLNI